MSDYDVTPWDRLFVNLGGIISAAAFLYLAGHIVWAIAQ